MRVEGMRSAMENGKVPRIPHTFTLRWAFRDGFRDTFGGLIPQESSQTDDLFAPSADL
jgi:hypothetical protein